MNKMGKIWSLDIILVIKRYCNSGDFCIFLKSQKNCLFVFGIAGKNSEITGFLTWFIVMHDFELQAKNSSADGLNRYLYGFLTIFSWPHVQKKRP